QVFTPQEAVKHAYSLLRSPMTGRILDLSCGAGEFLLVAYRILRDRYLAQGQSPQSAHHRILLEHLYGIDLDPWAVIVTRCRLFLECPTSNCLMNNISHMNAYHIFAHPLGKQSYQVIVGNPPWGGSLSTLDKSRVSRDFMTPAIAPKVTNSFAYFLEASTRLLAPQGQFSLLLPAAFLNAQCYQPLRKWLLQHVEIDAIEYAPTLFQMQRRYAPACFLAGTRTSTPSPTHEIQLCRGAPDWSNWHSDAQGKYTTRVLQRRFQESSQNTFNILYDPKLEQLLSRMRQNAFYLQSNHSDQHSNQQYNQPPDTSLPQGIVKFVLGIITGNNSNHVSYHPDLPNHEPIYSSEDLEPFHLRSPTRYIVYDKYHLQQTAPAQLYQSPEKIVYRFISKEITAAIDRSGSYTLNNLNCILPVHLPVSLRYLVGLLNSELLNTYYMYKCFTGKVTASNLCTLPIHFPTPNETRDIEQLVKNLETVREESSHQQSTIHTLTEALNTAVYRLYGFSSDEQHFLSQTYQELRRFPFV
ncbi:MAG: TaqI-like C-terminal specificity domain-containing protein, partial [Tumebacillaceae bacterium]